MSLNHSCFKAMSQIQLLSTNQIYMGSSPSTEAEEGVVKKVAPSPDDVIEFEKEPVRISRKKVQKPTEQTNPEQEEDFDHWQHHFQPKPASKNGKTARKTNQVREDASTEQFEALVRKNVPKSQLGNEEEDIDQIEAEEKAQPKNGHYNYPHPDGRASKLKRNMKEEEESEHPSIHNRKKPRLAHKEEPINNSHHQDEYYIHNSSIINNPHHSKNGHEHDRIDYQQYNSVNIRHKAIEEVHMQEHPQHPIKMKEPVYEHEKLYPKLLKDFHKEARSNTNEDHHPNSTDHHQKLSKDVKHIPSLDKNEEHHVSHHRPVVYHKKSKEDVHQQEEHEQNHKINLYKSKHHNEERHEEEEPEPPSHPPTFRRYHKADDANQMQNSLDLRKHKDDVKDLHQSMNVRKQQAKQPQEHEPNPYVRRRLPSKSKNEQKHEQTVKQQPDFRKVKKTSKASPPGISEEDLIKKRKYYQQQQERSIVDINKERQFNETEYDANQNELVTCKAGCGRKFLVDRIQKHEAICKRVFQQKRKEFNAQDKRIISKDQKKLMKKGEISLNHIKEQKKKSRVPKWKAQSIALRAHVRMGIDEEYEPSKQEIEMLSQEHHIDVVDCEYCGRHFNKNAAKTHIPFCKAQYEKQVQRQKFERHPASKRVK